MTDPTTEAWRTDPRERLLTAIDNTWAHATLGATPEALADAYRATVLRNAADVLATRIHQVIKPGMLISLDDIVTALLAELRRMADDAQPGEEQAAPVDWQTIAKQRETELKHQGERLRAALDERDQLRAWLERGIDQHMTFSLLRPDGTDEQLPCADWCHACRLDRTEAERDDAVRERRTAENRLRLAHQARRAREHQLDGIRRALCDVGAMRDDDPYSHADLEDVIRQAGRLDQLQAAVMADLDAEADEFMTEMQGDLDADADALTEPGPAVTDTEAAPDRQLTGDEEIRGVQAWMALDLHQALGWPVDHSADCEHQGRRSWAHWWAELCASVRKLARLGEGEEPVTDPRTEPTPGQWLWQFNRATPQQRLDVIAQLLSAAARSETCFLMAHEHKLEQSRTDALALQRARDEVDRWKHNTLHPQTMRAISDIDQALQNTDAPDDTATACRLDRTEDRLRAADFTAAHWHQWAIDNGNIPAAHAIACIRTALKGETDPNQLGLDDHVHDAFRAALAEPGPRNDTSRIIVDRPFRSHRKPTSPTTPQVLAEIGYERTRQDTKFGEQNHPDGTGQYPETIDADVARMACQNAAEGGYLDWLHILREEVAEAFAETDPAKLRAELIQVAAVAVNWIEAIDRRTTRDSAS